MAEKSLTLGSYLDEPKSLPYDEVPLLFDKNFCEILLFFKGKTPFAKWRTLNKLTDYLKKKLDISDFSLNIDKSLKSTAYMHDDGRIFVSVGLLLSRSISTLLSVYLHEFAHIWMSKQSNYNNLKSVQREFRTAYSNNEWCELISPIETYADALTLIFLEQLFSSTTSEKLKKKISKLIENRKEKLRVVYSELEKL